MLNMLWLAAAALNYFGVEATVVDYTSLSDSSPSLEPGYNGTKYGFFRSFDDNSTRGSGSRRVFGGTSAELKEFSAVCALLDKGLFVRCSCSVIAAKWVLTAAHCVTPKLAYVRYNTRRPGSNEGKTTAVLDRYQHPSYKVVEEQKGYSSDVVLLHNDVGLVRTKREMKLKAPARNLLGTLHFHSPSNLQNEEIKVLGFGRTERSILGEELFSVNLNLVGCERTEWQYCVCGVARSGEARGVCSGDSGGPVLYKDALIGVTSMGPVECTQAGVKPPVGATSVFTSLYQYADLINDTVFDKKSALRMRQISKATNSYRRFEIIFMNVLLFSSM